MCGPATAVNVHSLATLGAVGRQVFSNTTTSCRTPMVERPFRRISNYAAARTMRTRPTHGLVLWSCASGTTVVPADLRGADQTLILSRSALRRAAWPPERRD